jgi:hypothetical protein
MAWCWCGSNLVPAAGAISSTLLRSSAALQLAQRGFGAFADLLGRGVLVARPASRLSAHGQQAFGEAFDGELARLGHFFVGAAAGVLHLGLGAQELSAARRSWPAATSACATVSASNSLAACAASSSSGLGSPLRG